MTNEIEVFKNDYSGEGLIDIEEDLSWAMNDSEKLKDIPVEDGLMQGTFTVIVTWKKDD